MAAGSEGITIQDAYRDAQKQFQSAGLETPEMDAVLLLELACGASTLTRMTEPERPMTSSQYRAFADYIKRRLSREPVHRIIGEREFYGLMLGLNEATLIPRPDTEILVDMVLPFVHECIADTGNCSILDLGTGTGAIALAILSQAPNAIATATDIAPKALEMASKNAERNHLENRFTAVQSNWFENVSGQYDLIISNPPYIARKAIDDLAVDVRVHDPMLALDGGDDGLEAYRILASQCAGHIKSGGRIAVEIGFDQKNSVSNLFKQANFDKIELRNDLSGNNRALFFT